MNIDSNLSNKYIVDFTLKKITQIRNIFEKYNISLIQISSLSRISNQVKLQLNSTLIENTIKIFHNEYMDRYLQDCSDIFLSNYMMYRKDSDIILEIRFNKTDIINLNNLIDIFPDYIITKKSGEYMNNYIYILNPNFINMCQTNNVFVINCLSIRNNEYIPIIEWFIEKGYCNSMESYNRRTNELTIDNIPQQIKGITE